MIASSRTQETFAVARGKRQMARKQLKMHYLYEFFSHYIGGRVLITEGESTHEGQALTVARSHKRRTVTLSVKVAGEMKEFTLPLTTPIDLSPNRTVKVQSGPTSLSIAMRDGMFGPPSADASQGGLAGARSRNKPRPRLS